MSLRQRATITGFTTIEMAVVVVILGTVVMLGLPRLKSAVENQNFRSARVAVANYVATARAAAMSRGCRSSVHFVSGPNSRTWITSCQLQKGVPGRDTIAGPEWTESRWNVRLWALKDSITFDPRGLKVVLEPMTIRLRTKADQDRDSVMVNALGKVIR